MQFSRRDVLKVAVGGVAVAAVPVIGQAKPAGDDIIYVVEPDYSPLLQQASQLGRQITEDRRQAMASWVNDPLEKA